MPKFQFNGPSYESQSLSADAQKLMNWYLEQIESGDGNTKFALYPSPGTKTFIQFQPPPPVSSVGPTGQFGLRNARVALSAAQIKTAFANPIVLIPAPLTLNHAIIPISASMELDFNTTAFVSDPESVIGFGTSSADVFNNGEFLFPPNGIPVLLKSTLSVLTFAPLTGGSSDGAYDPATHVVNQPLLWANGADVSADPGDSSLVLNIQWIEIDVTTGQIFGGLGNCVFGVKTIIPAANYSSTAPTVVAPAPGTGLMIVPLGLLARFRATDSIHDLMQLQAPRDPTFSSNVAARPIPSKIINQPLSFVFFHTGSGDNVIGWGSNQTDIATGGNFPVHPVLDGGGTPLQTDLYVQYAIINPSTGEIQQNPSGGDLTYTGVVLTPAQIKSGTTSTALTPAPGPNITLYPVTFTTRSVFHTTSYPNVGGQYPLPAIADGNVWDDVANNYVMAPNFLGTRLFTQNKDQLSVGAQQTITNSQVVDSTINAPISWANNSDLTASPADDTAVVTVQYLAIDMNTGAVVSNQSTATAGNIRGELTVGVVA